MNLNEARREYASKFKPNPWIYWTDFLASAGLSWASLIYAVYAQPSSMAHVLASVIGIVAMLRAVLFIHEISHLKHGALPYFAGAYNLLFGIPFLAPSLLYTGSHGDHHRQNLFGTRGDPEYAPIAAWGYLRVFFFVVSVVAAPLLLLIRFAVLTPLSCLLPPLRKIVIARASALVINNAYERPAPKGDEKFSFIVQELLCAAWVWSICGLWMNDVPISAFVTQWYLAAAGTLLVNQVRTLAAHRYLNDGHKLTVEEQLLDSINLDGGSFLTVLAAPVGLRFHALHHFLPNVPYHALPALHKTLLKEMPAQSAYHATSQSGVTSAVFKLVRKPLHDLNGVYGAVKTHNYVNNSEE